MQDTLLVPLLAPAAPQVTPSLDMATGVKRGRAARLQQGRGHGAHVAAERLRLAVVVAQDEAQDGRARRCVGIGTSNCAPNLRGAQSVFSHPEPYQPYFLYMQCSVWPRCPESRRLQQTPCPFFSTMRSCSQFCVPE